VTRHEWVCPYAAIEPATGVNVALQAPLVNTPPMGVFLELLGAELGPMDHAVLSMGGARRHKSGTLKVPDNVTIPILPPFSPELNPLEHLRAYFRSHHFSYRIFDDYQHLLDAGAEAWQQLTPDLLRSVCVCDSITPELER